MAESECTSALKWIVTVITQVKRRVDHSIHSAGHASTSVKVEDTVKSKVTVKIDSKCALKERIATNTTILTMQAVVLVQVGVLSCMAMAKFGRVTVGGPDGQGQAEQEAN